MTVVLISCPRCWTKIKFPAVSHPILDEIGEDCVPIDIASSLCRVVHTCPGCNAKVAAEVYTPMSVISMRGKVVIEGDRQ